MIPGGSAWIELFVPADATVQPKLVLTQVNTGYRDMFRRRKDAAVAADAGLWKRRGMSRSRSLDQ